MLAVAKQLAPALDVRLGTAEELPIGDAEIDCVTCQFAMMFFSDRVRAVAEMRRVIRSTGRVAVATWASVEDSPGYAAMVELLAEEIGDWAAEALRAPFCLGTPDQLGDLMRPSFEDVRVIRREGQARFASLDDWLYTEIRGWTLSEHIDDEQFARLRASASERLAKFVGADGVVSFAAPRADRHGDSGLLSRLGVPPREHPLPNSVNHFDGSPQAHRLRTTPARDGGRPGTMYRLTVSRHG